MDTANTNSGVNSLATGEDTEQFCGFYVGKDFYAVSVLDVQEVIKPQPITRVPLADSFVEGLINLRGQIVTTISLRELFGLEPRESEDYMNVIVRAEGSLVSLVVDEINDVIHVKKANFEPTPDTLDPQLGNFVKGVYKLDNRLLIVLDLEKIVKFDGSSGKTA